MESHRSNDGISASSIVVAASDQVSSDLAGEQVILSLHSGRYYGLSNVGARIWQLLREPTRVADIRDAIVHEYDVEVGRCERDLVDLLETLADRRLIEVKDGPDSQVPAPHGN